MPPTVVTGERATAGTQGILSNERVIDMSDTIHLLDPNEAPLTAISMKLQTVTAISPKVEWLEDDYLPVASNASGASTTGDAFIIVDQRSYFRVGDMVTVVNTGEIVRVTSVSSATANQVDVIRAQGSVTAATIADNALLLIIGNANAENSTKRAIATTQKTALSNFTQIKRWEFGNSGTLAASELYGGPDLPYQQRKAGKEFRIQMERTYLFGEKGEITSGATPIRYTDGVIERITTNVSTVTTLTIAEMEAFLRVGFRYGPARKMLFASREIVSFLSIIADNKIQTRPTDEDFPLALTEYKSPHGKIYIATHNQLRNYNPLGAFTANSSAFHGWALLLDLDSIFHRPLKGRNTMLRTNIQANDQDGRIDGYLCEAACQLVQEQNHAIINGVTGAS